MEKSFEKLMKNVLVNGIGASYLLPNKMRSRVLKLGGISIESPQSTAIMCNCRFDGFAVSIGGNSFINTGCFFQADAPIVVGRNCDVGMQVMFSSPSHEVGGATKRSGKMYANPITVEDGCWIGTRAVILQGVTIGQGCIIAAGAVVVKDCEPNGLYAGVPARRLKDL